ncbi:MAG: hypothetical protein AAF639_24370, partial [Chloroflexota bacterium]
MLRNTKLYTLGLVSAMLLGIILAACFGPAPAPTVAEPEAASGEAADEAPAEQASESTLQIVKDRGYLICIVSQAAPAF